MSKQTQETQTTFTPSSAAARVASYYDANTKRFLALGGSGDTAAIHRAVWAPGVVNRTEAFLYLNRIVADAIRPLLKQAEGRVQLLDLGCGVGGTSTWLAKELNAQITGITISATQREMAEERARSLGLGEQVHFVAVDFDDPDSMASLPVAKAACAIESFAHVADARRFFTMAAERLEIGGRLIICDDFLGASLTPQARRWQQRIVDGWHLHSLLPEQHVIDIASAAGFHLLERHDHSSHIRSLHPMLLMLTANLTRLPLAGSYWQNLSGGTALQVCLRKGWTRYLSLTWEKNDVTQMEDQASSRTTGQ